MSVFDDIHDATSGFLAFLLRPVRSVIRSGLHVVAGWALNIFHLVGRGWDDMIHGATNLVHGLAPFAAATYHALYHLFRVTIPNVVDWASGHVDHLATALANDVLSLGKSIAHAVTKAWNDLTDGLSWLTRHVIDPIEKALGSAEHFLYHEVRDVVDLVTHPARLFEWVWNGMLAAVPHLAHDLATPTFRWFRHSAPGDAVEVAHGLESVLTALL